MKVQKLKSLLIVAFLASAICFSHIHQGSLSVDGIRYAHISARILESGDWFHLYDEFLEAPYANKPPVLFWLTASSYKIFGQNSFAAKFGAVCFVFCALLAVFVSARELYDEKTGYLSVLLLVANILFFRAVVDLSFEGFVLLGTCACFYVSTKLFCGEPFDTQKSFLLALGLFSFLISKPPYILVVFVPLCLVLLKRKALLAVVCSRNFWCSVLPVAVLGLAWYFTRESTYVERAFENQLLRPFHGGDTFFVNFSHWVKTILFFYAPLSILCVWALIRANKAENPELSLILYWLLPAIPVVLFVSCRGPYLLLQALPLSIFTAREFSTAFSLKQLKIFYMATGIAVYTLFLLLDVKAHGFHYLVQPFKTDPHLLDQELIICHDGGPQHASYPSRKRSEMVLNFEFKKNFRVYNSHTIPMDKLVKGATVLAETSCRSNLRESNLKFETIRVYGRVELMKITERPAEIHMGPFETEKSPKEDSSIH